MVSVAVIDDGIANEFFCEEKIIRRIEINSNLVIREVMENKIGHGTICAGIIFKYCKDIKLTSIKILNDKKISNKEQLIKAIEWCIENNIKVINLSLGTINYTDFNCIKKVIDKAYFHGIIIVAACSNSNFFTYPASNINVIGVNTSSEKELKEGEYIFNIYPLDGINITACSEHFLLKNNLDVELTKICNSYATPMITAKVCDIINKFPDIDFYSLKKRLYKYAVNYRFEDKYIDTIKDLSCINNALFVNINEPIVPHSLNIKCTEKISDVAIDEFDTLIVLNDVIKINYFVEKISCADKNIIIIDERDKYSREIIINSNNLVKFLSPSIIRCFYEKTLMKKNIDIPIILIYNYINSNDILKILRDLKEKFERKGYYVGGICTQLLGVLCVLEYIPFNINEDICKINERLEKLYKIYDYDIIILSITIDKKDTKTIKDMEKLLKPDQIIYLTDDNSIKYNKKLIITNKCVDMESLLNNNRVFNYSDTQVLCDYLEEVLT